MASTEELNGLIKGLADVVQTQQKTNADAFKQTTEQLQNLSSTVEALSKSISLRQSQVSAMPTPLPDSVYRTSRYPFSPAKKI